MKTHNLNRGHESAEHRAIKRELAELFRTQVNLVLCEHHCADLAVAMTSGNRHRVIAIEIERSPRNVIENISRDLSLGADSVLIVCPDLETVSSVTKKVQRRTNSSVQARIGIVSYNAVQMLFPEKISEVECSEERKHQHEIPTTSGDPTSTATP